MGLYIDTLLFLLGLYIVWAYLDKILQYFLNKTNKDSKKRKKKTWLNMSNTNKQVIFSKTTLNLKLTD